MSLIEEQEVEVTEEDRFLFDLQGFLMLRSVLTPTECAAFIEVLRRLEAQEYEDRFLDLNGPDRPGRATKQVGRAHQIRLNGVLRLDPIFDMLIDHPRVVPYLREFVEVPQLINTWSITKFKGAVHSGWHRGVPTSDFICHGGGQVRTLMCNTVYFLTDNGPEDGCVVALPGSHKSSFDLSWDDYDGLALPGSTPITGKAGDVLIFSEAVIHNGLLKTTEGERSNIYFNFMHGHYHNALRAPMSCHHFYLPPDQRRRLTPARLKLTRWMEFMQER